MDQSGQVADLVVVGGGTAGLVGAHLASRLGARVVLVEKERTGGDCLWTGCVPSKALVAAARAAADARRAHRLGVHVDGVQVDFAAVMAHVRAAIEAIEPVDSPDALRAAGVQVLHGDARFTSPTELTVRTDGVPRHGRRHAAPATDVVLPFHRALLATGSRPALLDVPGLAEVRPLTTDTLWELRELPRRLLVVGGGPTACELGQSFARLGSEVTMVERRGRLLRAEDPDAVALVHAALVADGVRVVTGAQVARVEGAPGRGGRAVLRAGAADGHAADDGGQAWEDVWFDEVLVAIGRVPRAAPGLAAAGIRTGPLGWVTVDRTLRTTNPRVWAAGDVTGHPQLTHVAAADAALAVTNALLGLRRRADLAPVPRVTFTDPEIAAVGAPSGPVGRHHRTLTRPHHHVDRAVADARDEGFARLVVDRRHRVVGATVVGARAGEAVNGLTQAVQRRMTTAGLAAVPHPYPTYGDGPWNAAVDDLDRRLSRPAAQALTRALVRFRRAGWRRAAQKEGAEQEVQVAAAEPVVQVAGAEREVQVAEAEPVVQVAGAEPVVQVAGAEPEMQGAGPESEAPGGEAERDTAAGAVPGIERETADEP